MTSDPKSGLKYSAPKLVIYGDMAKFTATATGSLVESPTQPNGQNSMRRP